MAAAQTKLINLLKIGRAKSAFHQKCWYSTKTATGIEGTVDKVVTISDNSTFVAWHPEVDFPYECSKPMPPKAIPNSSLIKEEALNSATRAFINKKPELARQELSQITYTTQHKWYPRSRDKRAKKTPMDREYL